MKQLAKFSIESETAVRLQFTDGLAELVQIENLSQFLQGHDLIKVQRAVNLRRHFIKRNLPPWAMGLGALAALTLLVLSTSRVAGWYRFVPLPKPVEVFRASVTPIAKAKLALNDDAPAVQSIPPSSPEVKDDTVKADAPKPEVSSKDKGKPKKAKDKKQDDDKPQSKDD